jgi:8-oxo-dGTP diphosphatase / 2-hydroxy-dATP diphosphatase
MFVAETVCTQIYLFKKNKVCLPLKKRGFGKDRHNGYGGKVEKGESLKNSALRELWEESGIRPKKIIKQAILRFKFLHTGEKIISHLFVCREFKGEPKETEEMRPFWFSFRKIPYTKMWPDDRHWFPLFLAGEKFEAEFDFLDNKPTIGGFKINILKQI